ncbi:MULTISPECIES: MalY/PatB family protein [unclassified Leifsonia]|uniref:MalY/PatB family protein n=1 Tax=unclassified Leifsonia TaxID=2663824 RepID=UPI0006F68D8D|nr:MULTISPECIES: aminotransferase class I/II-fold pyridoxal phosphate-dependent enzyme [unclassified Leifsonia]KQX07890.1 aspartate aminotransferase [Leifsonia sp. Root1293]KRA12171.1 aspartate aminotransferase [Leifsonia sp. Root60]
MTRIDAEPLHLLRERTSEKWRMHPADVLPLTVAEMDFPLAPPIAAALHAAVDRSDTGYVSSRLAVATAFAGFALERWGWEVDPQRITSTADVSLGIVEVLRQVTRPGDGVIITPPVYPPFFELAPEASARIVEVPLLGGIDDGWRLDLDAIDTAFAAGARAMVLCNPHNPVGLVHTADDLRVLADIALRHGATIVSDEIHNALLREGAAYSPFLSVSDAAREVGVAVTSASKAFNTAGLKCALVISASDRGDAVRSGFPIEVQWRTGLFGEIASIAAFSAGSIWLDGVRETLDSNAALLGELLAEKLPAVRYRIPDATYLAWLDLSALGWGDDPAAYALAHARVALANGPEFGAEEGRGHARLNFGTSPEILREAVDRLADLAARPPLPPLVE